MERCKKTISLPLSSDYPWNHLSPLSLSPLRAPPLCIPAASLWPGSLTEAATYPPIKQNLFQDESRPPTNEESLDEKKSDTGVRMRT